MPNTTTKPVAASAPAGKATAAPDPLSAGALADPLSKVQVHPDDAQGLGAIVNNSRGINFAYRQGRYAEEFGPKKWEAAAEAALKDMIADLKSHVSIANP